jgi:prepilin-type N-terminal cleavage/methylation domain-containing protein
MHLIRNHFGRAERGDTIIEVLISLAVVSLVLASAYAITTRNVSTNQDTQEHNQAQQIVQKQLEELRAISVNGAVSSFQSQGCIVKNVSTGLLGFTSNLGGGCTFDADATTAHCTAEPCYQVAITQLDAANNPSLFEITATWTSLQGTTSSVALDYGI